MKLIITTCPTCQGFGVTQNAEGALTCLVCQGAGVYLKTESDCILAFPIPEMVSSQATKELALRHYLELGLSITSFAITVGSAFYVLNHFPFSLSGLFWTKGSSHFLLGASGLTSIYALARWEHKETSTLPLSELAAAVAQQKTVNLKPYANARINDLLQLAASVAEELQSAQIDETVLLITLLRQQRIQIMLARLECSGDQLIEQLTPFVTKRTMPSQKSFFITPRARYYLYLAWQEAIEHTFPYLDLEDILLAFAKEPDQFKELFTVFDLTYETTYAVTRWYAEEQERLRQWAFWLERGRSRPHGFMNRAWTALPTPFLDQNSLDITHLASNGQVATVSVREPEIKHILETLGQTKRNNVLLLGEPGVGKNTLLGAIALRMVKEEVPEVLKDKRLVSMDLSALLSDNESAEQNVQRILNEVSQAGNVILVIPEVHTLVGTSDKALDAATLLANALNQGFLQIISTATYAEYHRYVESNPTFSALLEIVEIKEPTLEQCIVILEEEASTIEEQQGVTLTYPAVTSAVHLAKQYLAEQSLPGSAISLLDQAASQVKLAKRGLVMEKDVQKVIEEKTGVPIQAAGEQETDLLLHLEERLHERIIGQESAVHSVAEAIRRARAGLRDSKRPVATFLFVGPTGVGKTETAKAVADLYFGKADSMIRLDMSEYQDARSVYKLIGAPAADSESYTEGGTLTQPIREHPFSLILLDEIEKAYPDVLNLFLQLLDDGRLTENTGRTVYYNNSFIVATSNAGSSEILELVKQGLSKEKLEQGILPILQAHFKPEFLNRFDAIVPFYPLRMEEVQKIVELLLQEVTKKTAEQKFTISFAPEVIEKLATLGYDPLYGARPLRRIVQEKVEGLLARLILEKHLQSGDTLQITADMIQ